MGPHARDAVHRARGDLAAVLDFGLGHARWLTRTHDLPQHRPIGARRGLQHRVVTHRDDGAVGEVEEVWSALDEGHVRVG